MSEPVFVTVRYVDRGDEPKTVREYHAVPTETGMVYKDVDEITTDPGQDRDP